MRKTSVREMLALFRAPGQVRFSPTMNADASLGFPHMTHKSAHVAMNPREGEKFALVRPVGTTSRANPAARTGLAQREKVGYCPNCTLAAHAALPPTYALGEFHLLKARGLALRGRYALWAPRRLVAWSYATIYGPPHKDVGLAGELPTYAHSGTTFLREYVYEQTASACSHTQTSRSFANGGYTACACQFSW